MNKLDDKRLQLLLEIMTPTGAQDDSIDALLQPWRRLAGHLCPLVGESGFCALYSRTLRLSAGRFDWMAGTQACKSVDGTLAGLREAFAAAEPAVARAGNAALLKTFTGLLADLIGEALTARLLASASTGGDGQQQEHN